MWNRPILAATLLMLMYCEWLDGTSCMIDEIRKRVPAHFYRSEAGSEPVRDWLLGLNRSDRRTIGRDIQTVEFGWPIGMPVCRPLSNGLYEVRSNLADKRIARVIFFFHDGEMVLLHGFIKKTQKTLKQDMNLAMNRKREIESGKAQ